MNSYLWYNRIMGEGEREVEVARLEQKYKKGGLSNDEWLQLISLTTDENPEYLNLERKYGKPPFAVPFKEAIDRVSKRQIAVNLRDREVHGIYVFLKELKEELESLGNV